MKSNWTTEAIAKTKHCPIVQVSDMLCCASDCMAWVWGPRGINTVEVPESRIEEVDTSAWVPSDVHGEDFIEFERLAQYGGCGLRRLP